MSTIGKALYAFCIGVGALCYCAALIVFVGVWVQDHEFGSAARLALSPLGYGMACFLVARLFRLRGNGSPR